MRKNILLLLVIMLFLSGCGEPPKPRIFSAVSSADCYLCGGRERFMGWGEDNLAIISLNNFACYPIEINRYDGEGRLIAEITGAMTGEVLQNGENGFCLHLTACSDRGYGVGEITFGDDRVWQAEKTAVYLCQHCLDNLLADFGADSAGVAVLDLKQGRVYALREYVSGFQAGNYYFHYQWQAGDLLGVNFLAFYCPLRY